MTLKVKELETFILFCIYINMSPMNCLSVMWKVNLNSSYFFSKSAGNHSSIKGRIVHVRYSIKKAERRKLKGNMIFKVLGCYLLRVSVPKMWIVIKSNIIGKICPKHKRY